jgi:UDP-N-acetylglucosamine diphosphorylase/glucosamine-1-phosphate N-acetyltransferase
VKVCVFEDDGVGRLEPLALARPAFDLWCGACSLLERQRRYFGADEVALAVRPLLERWCGFLHPGLPVNEPGWAAGEAALFVNGRWLPPPGPAPPAPGVPRVALAGDQVAYAVVPAGGGLPNPAQLPQRVRRWREELPECAAGGHMIDRPWDLVQHNAAAIGQDSLRLRGSGAGQDGSPGPVVLGPPEWLSIDPAARVEPLAVVDTTGGAVVIDRGALVRSFSRLEGPCYVGPGTQVLGARVRASTLGPQCRVGGEVECSVLQGFVNMRHGGFLGHSYAGEWVNLAAGTQAADLRNDYATVRAVVAGEEVETGLLKAGAFLADHTRTGVGALLNCGTAAGPFAQLLPGGSYLPRAVPPFCCWRAGRLQEEQDSRRLFAAAAAALGRRGQSWTEAHAEFYLDLFEATAAQRRAALFPLASGRRGVLPFRG